MEPNIIINGTILNQAEAMTVRVAIESFAMSLGKDGLGDDDTSRSMTMNYLHHITSIREAIHDRVASW